MAKKLKVQRFKPGDEVSGTVVELWACMNNTDECSPRGITYVDFHCLSEQDAKALAYRGWSGKPEIKKVLGLRLPDDRYVLLPSARGLDIRRQGQAKKK